MFMVRKAASAAEPAESSPPAFEESIRELEQIVQRMESGSLSLEESLAAYRRGAELVGHCRLALTSVQHQVRLLEGDLLRSFDVDRDVPEAERPQGRATPGLPPEGPKEAWDGPALPSDQ
ncbi:MAG: exodeoxyribonuclease small subunit [Pseudomonadota bacterium]|jgi:exodeoxyribonuclease VII small subunit